MLLTAEAYEQFFESLRVESGGVPREKRTTSRVHLRVRIEIVPIDGSVREEKLTVWTHNISNHGISLTTSQPLIRDCQFLIELPRQRGGKPLTLICTVKHSRALGPRQFRVGATQRVAREDEIPAPTCEAASERRGGYRSVKTRSAVQALRKPPPLQRLIPTQADQEVERIRKGMFG